MDNNIRNSHCIFVYMDQSIIEKQYCQSCGMPLRFDVEEYLGTNADHSLSDEFCYYCLKDGEYTVDIPMEQMVDIWVKYTDKYNWYSDTNYTPDELRILLNKRLPTLRRWHQKEETMNIHHETINRIKAYIDQNLFQDLDAVELVRIANLSLFHFRRIFKAVTGENIGTYVQRLRLEYVAHLLIATSLRTSQILEQTNYQTKFSLAKAFRKHFGVSMSIYRMRFKMPEVPYSGFEPDLQIRRINTQKAYCLQVGESFRNEQVYNLIWQKLILYKEKYLNQKENLFVSISKDNPSVTPLDQCRFYLGVTTDKDIKPEGKFSLQEIPGGMYAVFRHRGSYGTLSEIYRNIYENWLPQSNYHQKHPLSFEVYLNTPREVSVAELLTEVYIPIDT